MDWPFDLQRAARSLLQGALSWIEGSPDDPVSRVRAPSQAGRLMEITDFGSNPGGLRMLLFVPPVRARPGGPLVVLLHGCGQDAAAFGRDSGWLALARRLRFPLLLPVQVADNNRGRCFNWFRRSATARDQGEACSIRQMVGWAAQALATGSRRTFVAGLSAGGAMAARMLAAYPDVFAAGAAVAGLPVGCAGNEAEALLRMVHAGPALPDEDWAGRVRAEAPAGFRGPWPRLSIWSGMHDRVVHPGNAELLARQWTALHGVGFEADRRLSTAPRIKRETWGDPDRPAVERWTLDDLGHAYPIHGSGHASEWVAQARLSAT
ncbi:MAG: PHB depolymerase family esterase, partial [Acetobacteraceae bacterium]|nr:PHB depolymerase family esterase [Acetobacteraceae bacterium]